MLSRRPRQRDLSGDGHVRSLRAFVALLLCDLTFARRKPAYGASLLLAVVCGLGMMIKGNLLGLALVKFLTCASVS